MWHDIVQIKLLNNKLSNKQEFNNTSGYCHTNVQLSTTIELPGLRWQGEGYNVYRFVCVTYILLIQQSRYGAQKHFSEFVIKLE